MLDSKTILVACVLEAEGNPTTAIKMIKGGKQPAQRSIEKAQALVNEGKAITLIDKDAYPDALANSPFSQLALFVIRKDEGAPELGQIDAILQPIGRNWEEAEIQSRAKVELMLLKRKAVVAEPKDGMVHIRYAGDKAELVVAHIPEFEEGHPKPSDVLVSWQIASALAKDAYWFHLEPHSTNAMVVSFHVGYGEGNDYFLAHEGEDECN